jgi:hypothetical protein
MSRLAGRGTTTVRALASLAGASVLALGVAWWQAVSALPWVAAGAVVLLALMLMDAGYRVWAETQRALLDAAASQAEPSITSAAVLVQGGQSVFEHIENPYSSVTTYADRVSIRAGLDKLVGTIDRSNVTVEEQRLRSPEWVVSDLVTYARTRMRDPMRFLDSGEINPQWLQAWDDEVAPLLPLARHHLLRAVSLGLLSGDEADARMQDAKHPDRVSATVAALRLVPPL